MEQINDLVRARIRKIRKRKRLNLSEAARRAGMPVSSYAALEYGDSRFRLDTLHQVIRALDVDIFSVWPAAPARPAQDRLESWKNEFRLGELVSASASEGGSLFWIAPPRSRSLLAWNVHETRLQRLMFWLDESPAHGTERLDTARQRLPGGCLSLVLEGPRRLEQSRPFIKYYMELWAGYILVAERPGPLQHQLQPV